MLRRLAICHLLFAALVLASCAKNSRPDVVSESRQDPSRELAQHLGRINELLGSTKDVPASKAALREYATQHGAGIRALRAEVETALANDLPPSAELFVALRETRRLASLDAGSTLLSDPEVGAILSELMNNVSPERSGADAADGTRRRADGDCDVGKPCSCTAENVCLPKFTCNKCCAGVGPSGIAGCGYPPRRPPLVCEQGLSVCDFSVTRKCLSESDCAACEVAGTPDENKNVRLMPKHCW
jgi:hypothetical protein